MRKLIGRLVLAGVCALAGKAWAAAPYLDPDLPLATRVADLESRLTLKEKMSMLYWLEPPIPRLGILKYQYGNDAIHGIRYPGVVTSFPQTIGQAASFNPDTVYKMYSAISDEARAKYNQYHGDMPGMFAGCLCPWSPTVNMVRDPRWGRSQETYGEDPYLSSRMAIANVKGLQGDDPKYLKTAACVKHFAGNNQENNRFGCNANANERYWFEFEFPPYKAAVQEANVQQVMTSYSAINGVPCSGNKWLVTDVLRGMWGFKGYVTSDCGAISNMVDKYRYVRTPEEAIAKSLNAGIDMECGGGCLYPDLVDTHLLKAIQEGLTTEAVLNRALGRILTVKFKLGMFDPPERVPYSNIGTDVIASPEHFELARESARENMVLLRNVPVGGHPLLPLDADKIKTIAVVGPRAATCELGDYTAENVAEPRVSPLMGLEARAAGANFTVQHVPWRSAAMTPVPMDVLQTAPVGKGDAGKGLHAEYFSNDHFDGVPEVFEGQQLNFDWTIPPYERPGAFSVRWTGVLVPPAPGKYAIGFVAENGARFRVLLGGQTIIDRWNTSNYNGERVMARVNFYNGSLPLRVEYAHHPGGGKAQLLWQAPAGEEALHAAKSSDVVIAVLGLDSNVATEGTDLRSIELPKDQEDFIERIVAANPRTIVVLINGNSLAINWINSHVPAILEAWFPGSQGGHAIADVLFGDYNPAGRMPVTFYASDKQLRPFDEYDITKGRTYMYLAEKPLYAFGYGLSYSSFKYENLMIPNAPVTRADTVNVSVDVENTSKRDGDEVVQLYSHQVHAGIPVPIKQLRAFQRIHLKAGEKQTVHLTVNVKDLAYWDLRTRAFVVDSGVFDLMVGAASDDIRQKGQITVK
jgi:beta-glucosidase